MSKNNKAKGNIGDFTVTKETPTGRNEEFTNDKTGEVFSRKEMVESIENGLVGDAHIKTINGIKTPCSNPDGKKGNNLG